MKFVTRDEEAQVVEIKWIFQYCGFGGSVCVEWLQSKKVKVHSDHVLGVELSIHSTQL